jgi:5-dehydro-2-deoxygluconokinase
MALTLAALAVDHRAQFEEMADQVGAQRERIPHFKRLAVDAAARVAGGRPGFGMLIDGTYGREAVFRAADHDFWIGRPIEKPGSRPLDFDAMDSLGAHLAEWPVGQCVKVLCFYHPDDPPELRARQERELLRVFDAARTVGRELLVEIIASKHGPVGNETSAWVMQRLYDLGIRPDWWKLEGQPSAAAWTAVDEVIARNDPWCRGVVLLGLDAPEQDLAAAFRLAAASRTVKGFAVGRTIFGSAARAWLAGEIDDATATSEMADRFGRLVAAWEQAKADR